MYTVSRGPSKFVANARRGLTQNLERLDNFKEHLTKKSPEEEEDQFLSGPKLVFHPVNCKKNGHQRQHEVISPQHAEIINFVLESWDQIFKELKQEDSDDSEANGFSHQHGIVYYEDSERNTTLQDFTPFDLESWWGKRLFNSITKST